MRLEIFRREDSSRPYLTLVNSITRRHVATLSPHDNAFTSVRIAEAVNLYADLLDHGLLKPVLAALEKRKSEQADAMAGTTPPAHP